MALRRRRGFARYIPSCGRAAARETSLRIRHFALAAALLLAGAAPAAATSPLIANGQII